MISTETKMALILETIVDKHTIIPPDTKLAEQINLVLKEYHSEQPEPAIKLEDEPPLNARDYSEMAISRMFPDSDPKKLNEIFKSTFGV